MLESESQRLPGANSRPVLPMGEIVEVEGGHIVRSTGRKDRHSKVYTAKGPRDRRVRLSASTAIQFYDLQDRLGYDRPSKAVAWLIEKAKASIDELERLPEIRPPLNDPKKHQHHEEEETEAQSSAAAANFTEHSRTLARERARERAKERAQERDAIAKAAENTQFSSLRGNFNFNFYANAAPNITATHSLIQALQLQNPMDVNSSSINPSGNAGFQHTFYHPLPSQATQPLQNFSSQFETPGVVFCEAENSITARNHQTQQGLFSGSGFISEQHNEFGNDQTPQRLLRAYPWINNTNSFSSSINGVDFDPFGSLNNGGNAQRQQNSLFAIRGTLQSSSSPVRVRPLPLAPNLAAAATAAADHRNLSTSIGGGGGFSGFRIPARIQGIDELDDVKPSASSSLM